MSRLLYTVSDLVSQVRSQLDETNRDSVDTDLDILPALNRGQDFASDIYARYYPEPLLTYTSVTLTSGQNEYDIPEDCFEDRIQKIEVEIAGTYREVERISYRDISNYESGATTPVPYYYCVIGRKYRLVPAPTGANTLRLWYIRNPEKLVSPQGRITSINSGSNYVIVDEAGDSLTTEADQLGSYVNWIDGQTGIIRASLQIASILSGKITFRSTPTRSTVLNRTISGSIPSAGAQDDYLAPIDGTSVLYFDRPTANFVIQYAVAEMSRRLGGNADFEERVLSTFEEQVRRTWVGREQQLRVKRRSQAWGTPTRRWYPTTE